MFAIIIHKYAFASFHFHVIILQTSYGAQYSGSPKLPLAAFLDGLNKHNLEHNQHDINSRKLICKFSLSDFHERPLVLTVYSKNIIQTKNLYI